MGACTVTGLSEMRLDGGDREAFRTLPAPLLSEDSEVGRQGQGRRAEALNFSTQAACLAWTEVTILVA